VVQLYTSGYLKQAQDSRDISEYAYRRGAASLLDFLDAERSYRAVELAYRQALAAYMTALEQLKEAEGTRNLHEEPAMRICADRWRWLAALAAASAIMLVFAGCQRSGSKVSAVSNSAKSSDNAELFNIPKSRWRMCRC